MAFKKFYHPQFARSFSLINLYPNLSFQLENWRLGERLGSMFYILYHAETIRTRVHYYPAPESITSSLYFDSSQSGVLYVRSLGLADC